MRVTYAYPLVPMANFLSCFLCLIPVPWLLQHWNTGAWTHGIWSASMCFIVGVNTVLWADNVDIKAIVWCDITIRIYFAANLAVVTTNFVMVRRLCLIVHIDSPLSKAQRTKAKTFDLFFSIGVPVISIALAWFVQGHRFNIVEGLGCTFAYYPTPIFLALYEVWLVIFGALCAIYGVFIFRALIRRRNALREVTLVDPDISLEQFRRVIALGCTECLFTLPCTVFVFVMNVIPGIEPWKGLADAHYNFSRIAKVPASLIGRHDNISIQWNNWVTVFVSVTFFIFFGTSKTMWSDYRKAIISFAQRFGIKLPSKLIRTHPIKDQGAAIPPMVFKVRTIQQTSVYQSRATVTQQESGPDTQSQSDARQDHDLEKGILASEVTSVASVKGELPQSPEDFIRTTLEFARDDSGVDSVSFTRSKEGSHGESADDIAQ